MSALRCSQCNVNWPSTGNYGKCPQCGEKTWMSNSSASLEASEAESIVKRLKFEQYYNEHEVKRAEEEEHAAKQWVQEMEELIGAIDPKQFETLATGN